MCGEVLTTLRSAVRVGLAPVRKTFPKRFQEQQVLFCEHGLSSAEVTFRIRSLGLDLTERALAYVIEFYGGKMVSARQWAGVPGAIRRFEPNWKCNDPRERRTDA
jgi:hypothetical protein